MTSIEISDYRLNSQQIAGTKMKNATELLSWMGAMQAQDYAMVKYAVGLRLPGATNKSIEAAINKGEILRTHLLRPTWHLVSANDIYWILELTAPHIKSSARSRWKELELSEATFEKSNSIISEVLAGGKHLTREVLLKELENASIKTTEQKGAHLMLRAELDGVVCSGIISEKKQTYALLIERVPNPKKLTRQEALAELAKRYFTSHGPATLQDFIWWSGLPVADAKKALEMAGSTLISEKIDSQTYWFSSTFSTQEKGNKSVYLLPAFDEYMISYKDRSSFLPQDGHAKTISSNGIFRPIIVVDGQVEGIWKRTVKKEKVIIETTFFKSPDKSIIGLIEKAAEEFGQFLNLKTEIKHLGK